MPTIRGFFDPDSLEEYRGLLSRCVREDMFRKELVAAQNRLLDRLPTSPRVAKELGRLYKEIA